MQEPANDPIGPGHSKPARRDIGQMIVGGLMIVEGVGVALLSVPFLMFPSILSVFSAVAMVLGGVICWAGAVLAGFASGRQMAAAVLMLIIAVVIGLLSFVVMVYATCGGGLSCPYTMPAHVYAVPIAFFAFNAMCSALLWRRRKT